MRALALALALIISGQALGQNQSQMGNRRYVPKCPDGYTLVLRDVGHPACARDIIDPQ